jgi:signal transduction histidine kinase
MLIVFLSLIIVVLLIIIFAQYKFQRNRSKDLKYIQEKLKAIIMENTGEKLLVFTGDRELIALLIAINEVLDNNLKIFENQRRTELSMKKMLSNISHDLKTPLTVILGYIETIKLFPDMNSTERDILVSNVQNKTIELLGLINKFFDLTKLDSGDKEIPLTRVNVNELCRKNILGFYDVLSATGFAVNIDIPENPVYAWGNEEAIERVLNNLISNAINYGNDGKTIGLKIENDEMFAYIEVWDKGKGIDELHQDRVFERMYTLEDSRNRLYQGSGLGLSITKRLVEKMGGEILLKSSPYEKTSFTFKLKKLSY